MPNLTLTDLTSRSGTMAKKKWVKRPKAKAEEKAKEEAPPPKRKSALHTHPRS